MNSKTVQCIIGSIIGIVIVGFIYTWYNHVWFQIDVAFWKLLVVATVMSFIVMIFEKEMQVLLAVIFCATVIAQVLNWLSIITLPIFH